MREKQESKRNCLEDLAKLSDAYNTTRAGKELAEKELAKVKRQVEEARGDWMKKIRERRAEVRTTACMLMVKLTNVQSRLLFLQAALKSASYVGIDQACFYVPH